MNYVNRIFAFVIFLISAVVLFATVQPSVSFWDCGEFIAAGYYLQVPHPPGTPFFLLLGRIFSMLPFEGNIAYKVNIISVLSSALSAMFLYLIIVKLILNYKKGVHKNFIDALGTYIAAGIGALSLSFSDTFWFNGTEAEVYALSTFLFAFVVWLMMRWHERADSKDNEKYLLMIAYLLGISTGVHLMSVLAIVPVVMVITFRKYLDDEEACKKTAYIFIGHAVLLLLISFVLWGSETSTTPPAPDVYDSFDSKFLWIIIIVSAIGMGIFRKQLFNRNSFYFPLIIGGIALFFVYPGTVKLFPTLLSEVSGNNITVGMIILLLIFGALGFGVHYTVKNDKKTLHLIFMSAIFILLGFTTFAMVIIRSNQNPPMNENEPDTFTELISYLNREQYGDFPTFKRRFSNETHQQRIYTNYSSDLEFFWEYQMNHMMTRYLLWNFAGRESWDQDSGVNIAPFNDIGNFFLQWLTDIKFNGEVKDSLFGIPFLLGLLGIFFHFRKDWKMASVFMIMFILMGYLTAYYQNQQQPQPRERDYFYAGAYFVFALWIGLAVRGIMDLIQEKVKSEAVMRASYAATIILGIILVPAVMLRANYFTHDRSRNWIPWDYSYNLLQSCAPNAVLFTNGDNDTFPLWYLQDVEGVRRDVKVANLSLLNTSWYISQLKNNDPYKVGTVRMRMTDDQIERIGLIPWEPREVILPLPNETNKEGMSDIFEKYNISDSSVVKAGAIKFRMENTLTLGNIKALRVQDIMVKEIIEANKWERPIYFAVTCSEDSKIGLHEYLRMEGMAFRLVPEKRRPAIEFINAELIEKQLKENPGYSTDYEPGFKFRGLNDSTIFFDENHIRMSQNYRNTFMRLAIYYINTRQDDLAVRTLNNMEKKVPHTIIEMPFGLLYETSNLYYAAGDTGKYREYANEVETIALRNMEENPEDILSHYSPYRVLMVVYDNLKEYDKALELWQRLGNFYPDDASVKSNIEKYQRLAKQDNTATDSAQVN